MSEDNALLLEVVNPIDVGDERKIEIGNLFMSYDEIFSREKVLEDDIWSMIPEENNSDEFYFVKKPRKRAWMGYIPKSYFNILFRGSYTEIPRLKTKSEFMKVKSNLFRVFWNKELNVTDVLM